MPVAVKVPTILRKHVDNQATLQSEGETLAAVLEDLGNRYPPLVEQLKDDNGNLRRFLNVYLNDDDVRFVGGLEAKTSDGDVVTILPAVAGG